MQVFFINLYMVVVTKAKMDKNGNTRNTCTLLYCGCDNVYREVVRNGKVVSNTFTSYTPEEAVTEFKTWIIDKKLVEL